MKIIGVDRLVWGVDDIVKASKFCSDLGLNSVVAADRGMVFTALDGTGVELRDRCDPDLPEQLASQATLRQVVWGVADHSTLDEIFGELSKDRVVRRDSDGSIYAQDDFGFNLKFQITCRKALDIQPELVNGPGSRFQRPINQMGVDPTWTPELCTLSHFALMAPDVATAQSFYIDRLRFRVTDQFPDAGPFLRPGGSDEHHVLFLATVPPSEQGCHHFTFRVRGPFEVLLAGSRFAAKGYESYSGPGRHVAGSNYFWYFHSPMGALFEIDADMDRVDEKWVPRSFEIAPENIQAVLFEYKDIASLNHV